MNTVHPKEVEEVLKIAKDTTGMEPGDQQVLYETLLPQAEELVRTRIPGERKGLPGEMNYKHSFRVHEKVKRLYSGDTPNWDMYLAALLHDIVEDGDTTLSDLAALGFSRRTVELVSLCSHDISRTNKSEKWTMMIARLIEARDQDAWCIKMMDLSDNLTQSDGLSPDNRQFMRGVKTPLMIRLTEPLDAASCGPYRAHLVATLNTIQKSAA